MMFDQVVDCERGDRVRAREVSLFFYGSVLSLIYSLFLWYCSLWPIFIVFLTFCVMFLVQSIVKGSVLEESALAQITDTQSTLFKHGYHLAQEIERHSGIPTYYYLYRIGGESREAELQSYCPMCKRNWTLNQPLFDFLYFKCDHCRLVSNLSWHWQ